MDPLAFCPSLIKMLSDCGVALVFLPHIGGSFLHGASFNDGNKIVVGLTVRGKDADRFWFSLFHELGHIVLGHINKVDGTNDEDEQLADAFARDSLIPPDSFSQFISTYDGTFSKRAIQKYADSIGIDAGIVVGRLQNERLIRYDWYNDMKTKYAMTS